MILTRRFVFPKKLPFDADYIEQKFKELNLNVLRWAIVRITEAEFVAEAAVIE